MRRYVITATWVLLLVLAAPGTVFGQDGEADPGAQIYARGMDQLRQGDFQAAMESLAQAAGAEGAPVEHKRAYLQVRTINRTRKDIADEQDPEKWWGLATRLRNFYYQFRLYDELLALAREMHEHRPSTGTATLVADALLALGRNAEAEATLASVDGESLTTHARLLLGVADARQGKLDEARAILAAVEVPESVSPRFLVDLARLQVLCGHPDDGLATLTTAFETTAPAGLPGFREFVKSTPDFGSVQEARFAAALTTESKVSVSSCSGGDDCGSCPSRSACGGSAQ